MANSGAGELDFFALSFNQQMAVTAQALYGYGYSAPFSEFLERPVICELDDLKKVIIKLVPFASYNLKIKFYEEIWSLELRLIECQL